MHYFGFLQLNINRVVTKILSCRVNTTNRQGIKQLGISFGFTFLLVSCERDLGATFVVARGNLRPRFLMTAVIKNLTIINWNLVKLVSVRRGNNSKLFLSTNSKVAVKASSLNKDRELRILSFN